MTVNRPHYTNVLKFWRAIEVFTLPDLPGLQQVRDKFCTELYPGDELPWESMDFLQASANKCWKHTLYFYPLPKQEVIDVLEKLTPDPSHAFREPLQGNTCHSAIVVDQGGQPIDKTYIRSAFSYGIKMLREHRSLEELTDCLKKTHAESELRFRGDGAGGDEGVAAVGEGAAHEDSTVSEGERKEPVRYTLGWAQLEKELADLRELMNGRLSPALNILCISEEVSEKAKHDAPFMNSFYLNDLNTMIGHPYNIGKPLETYLTEKANIDARYNLLDKDALFNNLDPGSQSPGRWPANPDFGLYSAQQAALHLTLPALRGKPGLVGINGPPGTGKTTLLREIIADVVVSRARELLNTDITKLFIPKRRKIAEYAAYYAFHKKEVRNQGILVASNNNSAVENISRELPTWKNIDPEAFAGADYFSAIAQNLNPGEPCWGLISAVLGNSTRRSAFITGFWFNNGNGVDALLKSCSADPDQVKAFTRNYEEVAGELSSLLREYDAFSRIASEYHAVLSDLVVRKKTDDGLAERLEELAARLTSEYGIIPSNLPGKDFFGLSLPVIHKLGPYSSPRINKLRSEIFLKSLKLHEYAILVNAKYFRANLNAFIAMLAGKHGEFIDEGIAALLWDTFFFCVPVVSTTLASVERLFARMGRGAVGWLLLDEAGQATPQSVCGAIWRSQRCILIGDTLQIPPVVTLPEGLGELLKGNYGLEDNCWSPLHHSAQYLADRVTPAGTFIRISGVEEWTGIPLRAHRRCHEPMFSISNTIAYNGQMVKVTEEREGNIRTGRSSWIDVTGSQVLAGHAVLEEIEALQEMLTNLSSMDPGEIFVISPFRSIGDLCRERFAYRRNVRCGTVHTFQGKEAEIVFFILGTEWKNKRARQWASATPNILNVAITRARSRLYVIGNLRVWASCAYFNQLAAALPVETYQRGGLFTRS